MNKRPILDDVFVAVAAVIVLAAATGARADDRGRERPICENRSIEEVSVGTAAEVSAFDVTTEPRENHVAIFQNGAYECTAYLYPSADDDGPRHIRRASLRLESFFSEHRRIGFRVKGGDPAISSVVCSRRAYPTMTLAEFESNLGGFVKLHVDVLRKSFCGSPIDALNLSGRVPPDARVATGLERACPECQRELEARHAAGRQSHAPR